MHDNASGRLHDAWKRRRKWGKRGKGKVEREKRKRREKTENERYERQ